MARWRLPVATSCLVVALLTAGCGGDATPVETTVSTTAPDEAPATTRGAPPLPTAAPDPPATDPAPPPAARRVALGQVFPVAVGGSVTITGEALTLTYRELLADSRCPLDVQCITAGNATIAVVVSVAGSPPSTLQLNTTEGPASGGYGRYTVDLIDLDRDRSPTARLRVT